MMTFPMEIFNVLTIYYLGNLFQEMPVQGPDLKIFSRTDFSRIDFKPFERIQRIGDECGLEISAFTEIDQPGLYDLTGMVKWKSFFD